MKVLVTFALETEFAPWRARHRFRPGKWGTADAYVATIGTAEVGVILTGVGPKQAALRAWQAFNSEFDSVSLCISSGLAGALRPGYQLAQVLAARTVRSEVARTGSEANILESSGALVSFAGDCGATVVDRFLSAGRVVAKAEEKRHLGLTADAVEMESFEILREAAESGVPAVAIRAVSDLASDDMPLEDMEGVLTGDGKLSIPRVVGKIVLHPAALPHLVKLGRESKRAAEALAQFLDRYIVMVSERAAPIETRTSATIQ